MHKPHHTPSTAALNPPQEGLHPRPVVRAGLGNRDTVIAGTSSFAEHRKKLKRRCETTPDTPQGPALWIAWSSASPTVHHGAVLTSCFVFLTVAFHSSIHGLHWEALRWALQFATCVVNDYVVDCVYLGVAGRLLWIKWVDRVIASVNYLQTMFYWVTVVQPINTYWVTGMMFSVIAVAACLTAIIGHQIKSIPGGSPGSRALVVTWHVFAGVALLCYYVPGRAAHGPTLVGRWF